MELVDAGLITLHPDQQVIHCSFYRSQRSCGQGYVFTRVCDSVHGGVCVIPACIAGGILACLAAGLGGGCLLLGGVCFQGVCLLLGVCSQGCLLWGVSAPRGHLLLGGVCSWVVVCSREVSAPGGVC